ncbi:hypothetical protein ERO13_A04G128130v2 [Gossypium hirsutum]|nr:hypothetical protein ERO13_A04G128130v2 [Gossypium hirsutum]
MANGANDGQIWYTPMEVRGMLALGVGRTGVVRWGLLRRTEVVGASYGARAGAWLRHEGEGPRVSETLTFWAFRA